MATIFTKSTGNCWIIGPQEGIVLPFSFNGWQEIRMGGFFSIVSTSGFNTNISNCSNGLNSSINNFFIGFKDSGNNLPGNSGAQFIGITKRLGDTSNILNTSIAGFGSDASNGYGNFMISDTSGNQIFYTSSNQNGVYITNATGNTNYASFWGITLGINNNTFSGMVLYDTAFYTDVTIGNLEKVMSNAPFATTFITGFYTTGNNNTNNILQIPNSAFIYFPFLNDQLRIHSLNIDQYN